MTYRLLSEHRGLRRPHPSPHPQRGTPRKPLRLSRFFAVSPYHRLFPSPSLAARLRPPPIPPLPPPRLHRLRPQGKPPRRPTDRLGREPRDRPAPPVPPPPGQPLLGHPPHPGPPRGRGHPRIHHPHNRSHGAHAPPPPPRPPALLRLANLSLDTRHTQARGAAVDILESIATTTE